MKFFAKIMAALALVGAIPAHAASGDEAIAIEAAAAALAPNKFVWSDTATAQPVTVVVSLPLQRAFVFRGESLIAASAVSTGTDDKPTPIGVYPILQKAEEHRSNLYDSSMPFMQRLTWDGVALHAGANPGFPASHGCVRLPAAFARKLFGITDLGTAVVVTDQIVDGIFDPELLRTEADRANDAQLASVIESLPPAERAGN